MTANFPFQSLAYAEAYSGQTVLAAGAPCPVHIEPLPTLDGVDGRLPWPYVRIDLAGAHALTKAHAELITLSGVLAPSAQPPWSGDTLTVFKPHFLFVPAAGLPELSRKSCANIKSGQRAWQWVPAGTASDWEAFFTLYCELVNRRGLAGSRFEFDAHHFSRLASLPGIRLFGVANADRWGAMTCAAEISNELHLLHIVVSQEGLTSNASYAMMHALLKRCLNDGRTLYLGGVPAGDSGGVLRFKQRWSNMSQPSWLFRMVLQPERYARLAIAGNGFFPAYRTSW